MFAEPRVAVCADARVGVDRDAILAESIKKRQRRDDARRVTQSLVSSSLRDDRTRACFTGLWPGKEKNANNLYLRWRIF
jgi:hypothetical protein